MDFQEPTESGYLSEIASGELRIGTEIRDVGIIGMSANHLFARGERYGRQWFLKGLPENLRDSTPHRLHLMKEFEIHSRLHHPAIAGVVTMEDVEGIGLCIVMEWIEGENLLQALRSGRLKARERRRIMREVIEAAAYLHSMGVAHRDLKPANIILRNNGGGAVLIDFSLADSDDYVEMKEPAGTPGFISPEQRLKGGAHTSDDIYSLGIMMREICPGYGRIARLCTGPEHSRPEDAQKLLRLLDSRKRGTRLVVATLILIIAFSAAMPVITRLNDLSRAASEAGREVSLLNDKDRQNKERMARLKDSLTEMTAKMLTAESALAEAKAHTESVERTFSDGCRKIDSLIANRGKESFDKLTPGDNMKYNDEIIRLQKDLQTLIESYMAAVPPDALSHAERERIRLDLNNHAGVKLSEYIKQWTKRLMPPATALL